MRRSAPIGLGGAVLLASLAMLVSGTAFAYFTTSGVGNASAGVSKLTVPTIATATASPDGKVVLSWSAATAPGPGAVTYTVRRDGNDAGGNCSSTLLVTTCTDSGLALGTYAYTVTAKWRSWTATSSTESAQITVGPADHFILTAASSTPAAAATNNLTITAKDMAGHTVPGYTGSRSLTFSGASASPSGSKPTVSSSSGSAISFGSTTTISFTAGVATITSSTKNGVMRLYRSGSTEIDVSDGTISTDAPLEVTVTPLAASKLVLTAATTTPVAGAIDNLTVTAQDTYGNVATSYSGPRNLTYSNASASPNGTAPTVSDSSGTDIAFGTALITDFTSGIASVSGTANGALKLYKPGSTTVKVSDGSFSAGLAVTVSAAAASQFALAAADATPVAAANNNLTITALDPYGSTATSYTGTHELVFSGSSASPNGTLPSVINSGSTAVSFGSPTALTFSSGVAKGGSSKNGVMKLTRAGAASITVSEGTISDPTPLAVTVSPGSAARWALTNVSVSAGTLEPACVFTCTLTELGNSGTVTANVAVADSVGNTVSGVGKGRVAKVTTNGSGTVVGTPLSIPSSGPAESAATFTYTSKSSGNFTEVLTVATSSGTTYPSASLTAGR